MEIVREGGAKAGGSATVILSVVALTLVMACGRVGYDTTDARPDASFDATPDAGPIDADLPQADANNFLPDAAP